MNREFRAGKYRYFASLATPSLAVGSLSRWSLLVLVVCLFSLRYGSIAYAQTVVDGGLTAPEFGWSLSPNLLVNGDFSQGTTGWTFSSKCFAIDPNTLDPNGNATLEMSDSGTCTSATPIAKNSLKVVSGQVYTLSGEMMSEDFVGPESYAGGMFDLFGYGRSPVLTGTNGWTSTTLQHMAVPAGTNTSVRLQTYGAVPTGNAWFANMSLQQEIPPGLQMFLLYPNYRGLMFSDQSQIASMDLTVTPPAGTSLSSLQIVINATDVNGNTVASETLAPQSTDFTASFDMSALPPGSYQVGELSRTAAAMC